ncbi:MAG: hypothetical protein HQK89_12875 [Nitrospirae bacterium]|nr:hypothetical protein [Nitrospirota bacterium]
MNIGHDSLSGNCCVRYLFSLEFSDNTHREIYREFRVLAGNAAGNVGGDVIENAGGDETGDATGTATINDIGLLQEKGWNECDLSFPSFSIKVHNIRERSDMLARTYEAHLRSEYQGIYNVRSKCIGIMNILAFKDEKLV